MTDFVEQLKQNHLIPLGVGSAILCIGGFLVFSVSGGAWKQFIALAFLLSGMAIGHLTPEETGSEKSGKNTLIVLVAAWTLYLAFPSVVFPDVIFSGSLMIKIIGVNIINGFAIILGALGGRWLRKKHGALY